MDLLVCSVTAAQSWEPVLLSLLLGHQLSCCNKPFGSFLHLAKSFSPYPKETCTLPGHFFKLAPAQGSSWKRASDEKGE